MNRVLLYVISSVFLFVSCDPDELYDSDKEGYGSLSITICTSTNPDTKAGTEADGDLIKDIHLWLAMKSDGTIVKYGTNKGDDPSATINPDYKTAEATFYNIERGDYYLYIVANLPSALKGLSAATNISTIDAEVLPQINTSHKPPYGGSDEDTGMPLSIRQEISITAGQNYVSAELLRVCGRLRITIKNNTYDKNIFLQSLSLEDKNPSTGYLIHREDHTVPSGEGITYNNPFSKFESAVTSTDYISPGEEKTYIDQYLYETGLKSLGESLKFNINGSLFPAGTGQATLRKKTSSVYTVEKNSTTKRDNTKSYLIKNANNNSFLFVNNNDLRISDVVTDLDEFYSIHLNDSYLWRFELTGDNQIKGYIKNLGGKYLYIRTGNPALSPTLSDTDQDITTRKYNDESLQIYYSTNDRNYQIYNNNGTIATYRTKNLQTENNYLWELYEVTKGTKTSYAFEGSDIDFTKDVVVHYLNNLGEPVVLKNICRNEDINIRVNIYYSPAMASFDFEVEPWKEDSNETTFD